MSLAAAAERRKNSISNKGRTHKDFVRRRRSQSIMFPTRRASPAPWSPSQ